MGLHPVLFFRQVVGLERVVGVNGARRAPAQPWPAPCIGPDEGCVWSGSRRKTGRRRWGRSNLAADEAGHSGLQALFAIPVKVGTGIGLGIGSFRSAANPFGQRI